MWQGRSSLLLYFYGRGTQDTVETGDRQCLTPGEDILTLWPPASDFLVMEMGVCDMPHDHLS